MSQQAESPTPSRAALLVVDVQRGLDDATYWGRRNNPECERNIETLIAAWRESGQPVVFVRHDSTSPRSPLRPGTPGNAFKACLTSAPDLMVTKQVNSAFYGEPDLQAWLDARGIRDVAICGITTNHCCESTARMAGNLGYRVQFVLDATHAFDMTGVDGVSIPAEDVVRMTGANLQGEFADVIDTRRALERLAKTAFADA